MFFLDVTEALAILRKSTRWSTESLAPEIVRVSHLVPMMIAWKGRNALGRVGDGCGFTDTATYIHGFNIDGMQGARPALLSSDACTKVATGTISTNRQALASETHYAHNPAV